MEHYDWVLRAVFNYGLPTFIILVIILGLWYALKSVWKKLCDFADASSVAMREFLKSINDNDTRRTEVLHALTESEIVGHEKTHGLLHETRTDIKRIEVEVIQIRGVLIGDDIPCLHEKKKPEISEENT